MTQTEQAKNAKEFAEFWKDKGDEKQHTQSFWTSLLREVYGVSAPEKIIDFEKRVKIGGTKFIDAYLADTRVAIEQKGTKIDLDKPEKQSDGTELSPFGQAKRYNDNLPFSEKCRWIVVSNFTEFRIHDMEKTEPEKDFETVLLKDLEKDYYRLQFLVDQKNENIRREEEISIQAGKLVGKLYDAISPEYKNPDEKSLRSLNILCVRIVFCLYAEDAGQFETRTSFEDYIKSFNLPNLRTGIINLFKALDTKIEDRDKYDETLKPFPYVNGGLFKDEQIEIPNFTQEIVDVIVNHCAPFNWSEISPTIFGAVFESTLNPETRRKGGMHYTSIQNIHKVIDPLFMDDLNAEFEEICATKAAKQKTEKLHAFQKKLGSLTFLDHACGSGNFLTETYLSLRRLENKVISILNRGERAFGFDEFIKVHINQFYGIEINDFAVTVAKTALWIAESQMVAETEAILSQNIDFLPLTTNAFIVEGNALRLDWSTLQPSLNNENFASQNSRADGQQSLFAGFAGFTTQTDGTAHEYNYIMGNPPFVGARMMEQGGDQKKQIQDLFGDIKDVQDLDYVCGWYKKAAELIQGTKTEVAFVSTNSICQGSQVPILWNVLLNDLKVKINFAYQTFKWDSESTEKAAVHCVIVGFASFERKEKVLFFSDSDNRKSVANISPYLIEGSDTFVTAQKETLCDVPKMNFGNQPRDGGNFVLTTEEKEELLKKDPSVEKFIRPYIGAEEFINGKERWCLWLKNASPAELKKSKVLYERVEAVRNFRLASKAKTTNGYAKVPNQFAQITQSDGVDYLIVPRVSSERRQYVPIGFATSDTISSDAVQIVPNATLYHFGVLTSSVHMAWMRAVAGRLEMRYRYSKEIVYNTFPFVLPKEKQTDLFVPNGTHSEERTSLDVSKSVCSLVCTQEQAAKIERTAQAILDARAKYPDSSLADLYDETLMPADLRRAHRENDKAVMQAYGFKQGMEESEIVAELFKLYEALTK
ncbi:MAG: class I SAM-dependent DNA methyltransferase [Treponema sp.]|nr:class I SAM-dependent DNA methyltransferase [Treponema sp.]